MRRWTLLLVSHDSEAPRSYSISERTLRAGALLGVAFALVAMIGVGTVVARLGSLRPVPAARSLERETASQVSSDVRNLRSRVARLNGVIDTIRQHESELRAAAGVPKTDSTFVKRFIARIPAFLKPRHARDDAEPQAVGATSSVTAAGALSAIDWSDTTATRKELHETSAGADSLASYAMGLAANLKELADGTRRVRDTLEVFTLREDSIAAMALRGRVARIADTVLFRPSRSAAIASGTEGTVTRLIQSENEVWELDLRSLQGQTTTLSALGRPLVRMGEKVVEGQMVLVMDSVGVLRARMAK